MNYATIKKRDIANGVGVRVSLFVSGCTHHCKNCFNKETWDFSYGEKFTEATENLILDYLEPDFVNGLSLLGGEPFEIENQEALTLFLRKVKTRFPNKDIWCYTGTFLTNTFYLSAERGVSLQTRCCHTLMYWLTVHILRSKKIFHCNFVVVKTNV